MKKSRCDDAAVAAESGVDVLGKFGSTEELLSAYNALQSEFTKRCQLVKELQARLDATGAQAEDNAAPRSSAQCGGADGTIAERGEQALAEVSADAERAVMTDGADEADDGEARIAEALATVAANAAECAAALADMQPVMDECLARYKKKLLGLGTLGMPCGTAVITPARRPRTLSDAKRLADEMLKYN